MEFNLIVVPKLVTFLHKIQFPKKYGIMDAIFGKALSKQGIGWYQMNSGKVWKLDMKMVTHRWILYGSYDYQFIKWSIKNVPVNGVIVDSGANIGQMTLYFQEIVHDGQVLAFEPSSEAADWLNDCILANKSVNVELIRKGLGETNSVAVLVDKAKEKNKDLHAYWSSISDQPGSNGEQISITALMDEVKKRKINQIDLWKLDVEGYELPALKGAEELFVNKKIKAVYAELAIKHKNNIKMIEFFSRYGYQCHYIDRKGNLYKPDKIATHQTNAIFLPL